MKRRNALALALTGLAGSGCVAFRSWRSRSIPATGGEPLQIRLADTGTTLLQKDRRWADDRLGPTAVTLGTHGCTVCCVAMACTRLGVPLTPRELNQRLALNSGYLSRGWLVWNAIPRVTAGRVTADYLPQPSHAAIDQALRERAYPVVKHFLPGGTPHWLLVLGKEGQEYLVRDPLKDTRELLPLSSLTPRIHAVRLVRKA